MRGILLSISILLNIGLVGPTMASHLRDSDSKHPEASEKVTSGYVSGRWVDGVFEYEGTNGKWSMPNAVRVAKKGDPMAFVNSSGETVPYEEGDVLFRIDRLGWFKAKKDIPRIEDPMVPNPSKFPLTLLERGAIRATNIWRRARNLPALIVDPILMKTARNRPAFSHTANGKWSWDEAADNGFRGPVTDNLSSGDRTPEDSIANLASDGPSEGHYKQLMGWKNMNGWRDFKMNRIGVSTTGPGGTWTHIYGRED